MQRIFKERDRLLRRAARLTGLAGASAALLVMLVPGGLTLTALTWSLPLLLVLVDCLYLLGRSGRLRWVVLIVLSGIGIILAVGLPGRGADGLNLVEETVIGCVAACAVSSVALVLVVSPSRLVGLLAAFGATLAAVLTATGATNDSVVPLALTISGWFSVALVGWWVAQSVPRVMQRIAAIGRAHLAERHASELEAQRRQDARLLHDTVLATLTLLAHSGVGVSPAALRQQSGDDARLLRQLRLGGLPTPRRSGVYTLEPATESTLGSTLESVKQRFGRMGLDVDWHGSGQVLLPSDVLDSFLLALGECLENVRRHAGVDRADVTISDDDTTVRAMVTDAGVGFDIRGVSAERLGFAESVVARLRDVGGNARLFSSPGSGTTVVLEVPK
ncbi:MAG: histidine kinase [Ramlibacter sp.]|nr:histidine kinase [Cryobacterium sp.]